MSNSYQQKFNQTLEKFKQQSDEYCDTLNSKILETENLLENLQLLTNEAKNSLSSYTKQINILKSEMDNQTAITNDLSSKREKFILFEKKINKLEKKYFGLGTEKGIEQDIENIMQKLQQTQNIINLSLTENNAKYDSLFQKIEELLPGATAAGLAEAYEKSREEHRYNIRVWQLLFGIAMFSMFLTLLWVAKFSFPFNITDISLEKTIISLLRLSAWEIPFIWLGILANKKINQETRLYEEYLHKWAVVRNFDGMKKIFGELKSIKTEVNPIEGLLINLLTATSTNPSETLNRKSEIDSPFHLMKQFLHDTLLVKKNSQKESSSIDD